MVREDAVLRDYLKIISRRRWVAVAVFVAIFSSVVIYTLTATPVYKSTARVFVNPGTSQNEVGLQQTQNIDISSYIETQLGILKSDSIARAVVQKMRLDKTQPGGSGGILAFFGLEKDVPGPDKMTDAAVKSFARNLSVQVEGDSSIIRVSYTDTNPSLAATVANTVVQEFIERNIEMKVEPARAAITWLNSRLGTIKNQMTQSTNQLNDFKRSRDLFQTGENDSNISVQALSDLNQKLLAAQTVRSGAEVKYSMVQKLANTPDGLMTLPEVINNKVIQNMKDQQSTLAKEIADGYKKYGARHPEMIRLNTEMATLNRQMKQEEDFIVLSIKNSYVEALNNEESLKTAFDQQKAKAMDYEKQASEYGLMKQDVEGSRSIYDAVLKKFQESSLAGSMNMSNVQLLDQAFPRRAPSDRPRDVTSSWGYLSVCFAGLALPSPSRCWTIPSKHRMTWRNTSASPCLE